MCSKSFLVRWEMYFKAKDEASTGKKGGSSLDPKLEGSEVDGAMAEDSDIEDAKSRS